MINPKLRQFFSAFAMLVLIGGPVLGVISLAIGVSQDNSGAAFGRMLVNVGPLFFNSILAGGGLRLLTSIDARLEARA